MARFSPCNHCQTDNLDDNASECMACNYHPWRFCYHPDCNKLPPVKHEPMRTPPPLPLPKEEKSDMKIDTEKEKEKTG